MRIVEIATFEKMTMRPHDGYMGGMGTVYAFYFR